MTDSDTAPRRSPRGAERRRDAERTKRLILDAAIAEFADKGFAGARTSQIAARAGVNKQLISYYFGGKDGLAQAIGERWRVDEARLSDDSYRLDDMVANFSRAAFEQQEMTRLLAWQGLAYRGPEDDPDAPARDQSFNAQVARLRRRQADGELAEDLDPACVLVAMIAAGAAPVILPQIVRSATGADPRSEEFAAHYADQLARMVRHLAGRAGEGPAAADPGGADPAGPAGRPGQPTGDR